MDSAVAPSFIQEVDSGERPREKDGVDPRAPRYGLSPIWPVHEIPANAFKLSSVPGGKFIPFRVFEYPSNDANGRSIRKERMPEEQVADFYAVTADKFGTDFPELAVLEDESLVREIIACLANPKPCSKYPLQIGHGCATCWLEYLRGPDVGEALSKFAGNEKVSDAAVKTVGRLVAALDNAASKALSDVGVALRDVDDPKVGKDRFYDVDYLNIWHTHQNMPKTRTVVDQQQSLDDLTHALSLAVGGGKGGLTVESVQAMIDTANADKDAEILRLKAELAAKTPEPQTPELPEPGLKTEEE
jgi:hypothetical protein